MDYTRGHTAPIQETSTNQQSTTDQNIIAHLDYMKSENQWLKDEISALKDLFQGIQVHNHNKASTKGLTSTPTGQTPSKLNKQQSPSPSASHKKGPRKSIPPQKISSQTKSLDLDLDNVYIGNINKKLLNSCYTLARVLMNRKDAKSLVPAPPTEAERNTIEGFFNISPDPPLDNASVRLQQKQITLIQSTSKIDSDYLIFIHTTMRRWGIPRFTMDWDNHWDNRFNQIMTQFFLRVWKWGLVCNRFGVVAESEARSINMDEMILMAIYWRHAKSLKRYYKRGLSDEKGLQKDSAANTKRTALFRKSQVRQLYLQEQGVDEQFITGFDEKTVNSNDEIFLKNEGPLVEPENPFWCSLKATEYIDWIEFCQRRIKISPGNNYLTLDNFGSGSNPRARLLPNSPNVDLLAHIPIGLPHDFYDAQFLAGLSYSEEMALKIKPNLFNKIIELNHILPHDSGSFHNWPKKAHIMQVGKGKERQIPEDEAEFDSDDIDHHQIKLDDDDNLEMQIKIEDKDEEIL
ncbi:hypothetical protein O181_038149 [Austropuccinia psidii MF-1]|uniref:Uncharacterized protein n=1 Tax=Austropuccinia psidii MF-1 TaxID=1389203 RepID=A0A9Q3D7W9_9BASI|nr:hypothetical protein [Austropuccinia psidii MF-1]